MTSKAGSNVKKARELYSQGAKVEEISRILNESPYLVTQWVITKRTKQRRKCE